MPSNASHSAPSLHSATTLYAGDGDLDRAANYLAALLRLWNWSFDYLPSAVPATPELVAKQHKLIILSDYPAKQLSDNLQHELLRHVEKGSSLLMVGGWASYHGKNAGWETSPIAELLPVHISGHDDRVNCDQPALVVPAQEPNHPILKALPWNTRPPSIGGYNRVRPKRGSQTLLNVERYRVNHSENTCHFQAQPRDPLLVVGSWGKGKTAALTTDIAPHWVGGLVDWGEARVSATNHTSTTHSGIPIEVGEHYVQFLRNLLGWLVNEFGESPIGFRQAKKPIHQ